MNRVFLLSICTTLKLFSLKERPSPAAECESSVRFATHYHRCDTVVFISQTRICPRVFCMRKKFNDCTCGSQKAGICVQFGRKLLRKVLRGQVGCDSGDGWRGQRGQGGEV